MAKLSKERGPGFLTPAERSTLEAVCKTLLPSLDPDSPEAGELFQLSSAEVDLPRRVEAALLEIADADQRRQLRLFLWLLARPAANGFLCGSWTSFVNAPADTQESILRSWMESRLNLRRQAFQAIKRLALFLYYTIEGTEGAHPLWPLIGYPIPERIDPGTTPLRIHRHKPGDDLSAEVVVIGSGAGGGVMAAKLAEAGLDVLVVEKGGRYEGRDFHGRELQANIEMFERRGALTTSDLGIVVLAGSTLGGGTVVNWSTSLPTPDDVRFEWEREFGFEGAFGADYERSLQSVTSRLHIHRGESSANPQNNVLEQGGEALGHTVQVIPRNVRNCVDCTFCTFGCRYEAKRSSLNTYLREAAVHGARILVNAQAWRIFIERGKATGLEVRLEEGKMRRSVPVRAKAIVVCAGAIHTPALLRRSGLRNPNLGRHLRLHPVTAPVGWFQEPIRSWQGPPQTRMIDDLSDLDGNGYGVRFEVAPAHPGLWASALAWTSGRQHRRLMSEVDHLANIIVITRDSGSGWVSVDREGEPRLHYRLADRDRIHMMHGLLHALRIHVAAGAKRLLSPHSPPIALDVERDDLTQYLEKVRHLGLATNDAALFSAHQMGTARISGSEADGVTRPDGASWEVGNVFIADGSVFPTAPGVNPMVPIMATADYLGERIMAQL